MCAENLEYFQKLSESPACTDEYRKSIRKQLLDYYSEHIQGEDLDRYLHEMDYWEYAEVDCAKLLEILISRRMFRQAMGLVEEFGYEGSGAWQSSQAYKPDDIESRYGRG